MIRRNQGPEQRDGKRTAFRAGIWRSSVDSAGGLSDCGGHDTRDRRLYLRHAYAAYHDLGPTAAPRSTPLTADHSHPAGTLVASKQTLLAETMVTLADNLVTDFDVIELLTVLADRCVTVLGVSAAGLMLVGPDGTLRVVASSSEQMRLLELFELQTDQGPCLESFQTGDAVTQHDLTTATDRWPKFAPEAIASGFRSVYAVPMRLRNNVIGALNLFQTDAEGIDDEVLQAARAFANIATITILQYRAALESDQLTDQLKTALNTRIVIEQAKGIISERQGVDMERAFGAIRNYARKNNRLLSDVAAAVVAGTLKSSSLEQDSPPDHRRTR